MPRYGTVPRVPGRDGTHLVNASGLLEFRARARRGRALHFGGHDRHRPRQAHRARHALAHRHHHAAHSDRRARHLARLADLGRALGDRHVGHPVRAGAEDAAARDRRHRGRQGSRGKVAARAGPHDRPAKTPAGRLHRLAVLLGHRRQAAPLRHHLGHLRGPHAAIAAALWCDGLEDGAKPHCLGHGDRVRRGHQPRHRAAHHQGGSA